MGSCLGRGHVATLSDDMENTITIGKSKPLTQERIKWKSDVPVSLTELISKRDEFWETAPAFEGRKEIWDALKAAAMQAEQGDFALAQAILDGACISLPDGTLRESYDELGNRYKVPVYCLSLPVNLVEERSVSSKSSDRSLSNGSSDSLHTISVKLRLSSTGKDIHLMLKNSDSVSKAKQRLRQLLPELPVPREQRWFFGGKMLSDRALVRDCNIPPGFVIQVDAFSKSFNGFSESSSAHVSNCGDYTKDTGFKSGGSLVACLPDKLVGMSESMDEKRGEELPTPVGT
uniref:Ubiquitin-like domain-containing protein n=1 Tax=Trichuris muris TaxID=70415 RepID=A0A5S6QRT0_TRIMR